METWREKVISPSSKEWEAVIDELQKEFGKDLYAAGYDKEEMTKLAWAFSEAIYNKVKHGNGFDPQKKTRVSWKVSPTGAEMKVKDEGKAFDYEKALKEAEKKENKFASVALLESWNPKDCGAGLAITLRNLGRKSISYDEGGREVSLKYKRPKKPMNIFLVQE
jgi:anti-sigma regulatory factor (Ser/Thr protein kinase)